MGFFDSISEAVSNITGGLGDAASNVTDQASNITDPINGAVEDVTSQIPGADQLQDIIPGGESDGEEQK